MMTKIPINPLLLLRQWCRKRSYGAVAEGVRLQVAARVVRKEVSESASANNIVTDNNKEEIFWMRDPKTGNWIPENHFGEVDAADLREKFLSKTQQKLHSN